MFDQINYESATYRGRAKQKTKTERAHAHIKEAYRLLDEALKEDQIEKALTAEYGPTSK